MKAFILAAGFGRRMGRLCHELPKPLLPVAGYPLISHTLFRLYSWKIEAAVINVHYLGERIIEYLNDFPHFPLEFSHEQSILGTAGGLRKVLPYFESEHAIILINPDTIFFPLPQDDPRKALREIDDDVAACLFLKARVSGGTETGWNFRAAGRNTATQSVEDSGKGDTIEMRENGRYYYIGYAALRPSVYRAELDDQDFDLAPLWKKQGETGRLLGKKFAGTIIDAGTEDAYKKIKNVKPFQYEADAWRGFLKGWDPRKQYA